MIKYNLTCECGKTFESWFLGSVEYDILKKKKLINCISCDSTLVKKSVMAPNLTSKTNKSSKNNYLEKKIKKQIINFKRYVEKKLKNVWNNFPQEARRIHYDKKTSKGIYGKATPEETAELLEEGIDVTTIPWVDETEH